MEKTNTSKLTWQTSLMLDALRLTAAFTVFFYHSYEMWFNNALSHELVSIGHFCVIVFFVLSGYLISYTTINNNRGIIYYAKARLSRLYSVLLPSILITAACQLIIYSTNPRFYNQIVKAHTVFRYMLSSSFLSEVWFNSSAPAINGPLWSMSYEFWYYAIFGAWFFLRNTWKSYFFLLATILIAGPSILSMMPIWIMGCFAYKFAKMKLAFWPAYFASLISFIVALILMHTLPSLPFILGQKPLFYANEFLKDNIIGFFIALSLSFITMAKGLSTQPKWLAVFRKIADLTFPLYLLHFPFLILWKSLFTVTLGNTLQFLTAMFCILVIVTIIGFYLESKRRWWDNVFGIILVYLKKIIPDTSKKQVA